MSGALPVAVLLADGPGGQLLAWPLLRALEQLFPGRLQPILGPDGSFLCGDVPVRAPLQLAWFDPQARAIEVEPLASALGPCALFVNPAHWVTPSVRALGQRVAAGRSVSLCDPDDDYAENFDDTHALDRMFALAQRLDPTLELDDFCARPLFPPVAEAAAGALIAAHLQTGEKLLFVHPDTDAHDAWPAGRYARVLQDFLRMRPEYRALVCGTTPVPIDGGRCSERVVHIDPPREAALALVGRADLFLGVDSCFLRAADLCATPGVALFGPTRPAQSGYRLAPAGRDVDGRGSLLAISSDQVLQALIDAGAPQSELPLQEELRPREAAPRRW